MFRIVFWILPTIFRIDLNIFCVHANGGINGGVACVCAKWRVSVHFCAFLCFFVRYCAFFATKMACKKAQIICAEFCKNVQEALLCNTPFSYTPFCVSPNFRGQSFILQTCPAKDLLSAACSTAALDFSTAVPVAGESLE